MEVHGIRVRDVLRTLHGMTVEELAGLHGIGEVNAQSVRDWIHGEENRELLRELDTAGIVALQPEGGALPQVFAGKTFVVTGTLPTLSREQARQMIKDRGGNVSGSVSKKTDYLLLGENPGSKLEDAKKCGTEVLDEEKFLKLIKR